MAGVMSEVLSRPEGRPSICGIWRGMIWAYGVSFNVDLIREMLVGAEKNETLIP